MIGAQTARRKGSYTTSYDTWGFGLLLLALLLCELEDQTSNQIERREAIRLVPHQVHGVIKSENL